MKRTIFLALSLIVLSSVNLVADGMPEPGDTFFSAVQRGDVNGAKSFLDAREVNINDQNTEGNTALMIAVSRDDLNMVLALVPYRPSLDPKNNQGKGATDIANERGNFAIQQALKDLE